MTWWKHVYSTKTQTIELQDMIKSVVSFLQLFQSVSEKCGREKYVLISWAPQQETWIKYESILCGLAE